MVLPLHYGNSVITITPTHGWEFPEPQWDNQGGGQLSGFTHMKGTVTLEDRVGNCPGPRLVNWGGQFSGVMVDINKHLLLHLNFCTYVRKKNWTFWILFKSQNSELRKTVLWQKTTTRAMSDQTLARSLWGGKEASPQKKLPPEMTPPPNDAGGPGKKNWTVL